jgi:hypothetical protein
VQQPAAKNENSYALNLAPLRSAIGMMECWKNGIMGLEDWGIGVMEKRCFFSLKVLTNNCMKCYYPIIPPFHYSIIPGWNKQNGWLGILYYQRFVEFSIHIKHPNEADRRNWL